MLLLDRLIEYGWHFVRRRFSGPDDPAAHKSLSWLYNLRSMAVYEIDSVRPLFGDWTKERHKPISKRPPIVPLWAEWSVREENPDNPEMHFDEYRLGVVVDHYDISEIADRHPQLQEDFSKTKEWYAAKMFRYVERTRRPSGHPPTYIKPGLLTADAFHHVIPLFGDGEDISIHRLWPPIDDSMTIQEKQKALFDFGGVWDLPLESCDYPYDSPFYEIMNPWPPFMAFAFLHCKNIVAEENVPDERTQRRVAKAGNPPRVTYKTLKIEVPATVQRRGVYEGDEEDAGPKVRFHLCSGHFKHLTSERYKEKRGQWVWCPAHWKGSKELGEVHKRYRLEASN